MQDISFHQVEKNILDHDTNKVKQTLFHRRNLRLRSGLIYLISGPPQSGKTMFLRLLLRFQDPDEGTITWNGEPIQQIPLYEYRQYFSACFQDPFFFTEDADSEISYYSRFHDDIPLSSKKERINTLSSVVGFPREKKERHPESLNEEEKAKLQIARTLYGNADFILIDGVLDAIQNEDAAIILHYLKTLTRQEDKMVLFTGNPQRYSTFFDEEIKLKLHS